MALDTISYVKQGDGSFTKTVTHIEVTTDYDALLKASQANIDSYNQQISDLQAKLLAISQALDSENLNLKSLQKLANNQIPTKKTSTDDTADIDVPNEINILQAMIANLQAGTTNDPQAQADIDASIANLQAGLAILQAG